MRIHCETDDCLVKNLNKLSICARNSIASTLFRRTSFANGSKTALAYFLMKNYESWSRAAMPTVPNRDGNKDNENIAVAITLEYSCDQYTTVVIFIASSCAGDG